MKIALKMIGTEAWFGGDIHPVLDLIALADKAGIDILSMPEHVVMSDQLADYPYGAPMFTPDTEFLEPMVLLSAIAMRTTRMRLSTGVLLLPLRPAVLIAKQAATLDVLSRGRLELSVGVGWQKAEYDFEAVPWEGRFGRMMETIEACRRLWSEAPASFSGKHVTFDRAWSRPFPPQGRDLPILLGVGPSDISIERLASAADGWEPVGVSDADLRVVLARIHARMHELGRDPTDFRVRLTLSAVKTAGKADLSATLARLPEMAAAGGNEINIHPGQFCAGPEDFAPFLHAVLDACAPLRS